MVKYLLVGINLNFIKCTITDFIVYSFTTVNKNLRTDRQKLQVRKEESDETLFKILYLKPLPKNVCSRISGLISQKIINLLNRLIYHKILKGIYYIIYINLVK